MRGPKKKKGKRRPPPEYSSSLGGDKLTTGKSLKFLTVVRLPLPSRKIKRILETGGPKFNVFARVPKGWPLLALEMCKSGAESLAGSVLQCLLLSFFNIFCRTRSAMGTSQMLVVERRMSDNEVWILCAARYLSSPPHFCLKFAIHRKYI